MISCGMNNLVIVVDTADMSKVGHVSEFLEASSLLQIPFKDAVVPEHEVLYQDACRGDELLGSQSETVGISSGKDEL